MRRPTFFKGRDTGPQTRINDMIREKEVRVVTQDGDHLGILPIQEALTKAREAGLDLVEVADKAEPRVCRIMDYGHYRFEQAKKDKEARKRQKTITVKEIKMRPNISEHDYEFKMRHAEKFLKHGDKVKFLVVFRGRQITFKDQGRTLLTKVVEDLRELGQPEMDPKMDGRVMATVIAPLPQGKATGSVQAAPTTHTPVLTQTVVPPKTEAPIQAVALTQTEAAPQTEVPVLAQ